MVTIAAGASVSERKPVVEATAGAAVFGGAGALEALGGGLASRFDRSTAGRLVTGAT